MADIFRAPLFSRHHRRPEPPSQWSVPNLLTTTLAVAAATLPFNNAGAFPTQVQHPSHARSANADTSAGIPKTLTADATVPVFNAPALAGQHPRECHWLNGDTTDGTPLTLFPAAQPPFVNAPHLHAHRLRPVADTSQSSPRGLLDVVAPPIVNVPFVTPDRIRAVSDTSHGTPKTLYADAIAPFFNPPQFLLDRQRPVYDTSRGLNNALASFIPSAPFAQTDWPGPIRKPPFHETSWGYGPNPNLFPPVPTFGTGAVLYLPVRFWANSTSVGVVPSTNQANLKTWLPPIGVPIADKDGTMNVQWYRFFNYFANVKAGGPEAPTVTDIAASATVAQAQATTTAQTLTAVTQVVVQNAEALSATVEVAQTNALTGATQIPNVRRYVE